MRLNNIFWFAMIFFAWLPGTSAIDDEPARVDPPKPAREFRGVWVAVVSNIDWPYNRGSGTAQQKAELLAIMDRAVQLKLNAIIIQVRPECDAVYASPFEPWSEYLTGTMGRAPEPYYDPLAFAIEEAHRRGLELHAWFNPYRALHPSHLGVVATNHVSRTHPAWAKKIVSQGKPLLWLDPGERDVQDYSVKVIMDVVKRYDVDGVTLDDYFYPDQDPKPNGPADFPDEGSWKRFGAGGKLNRGDWRRENINTFIERVYRSIKSTKPWVKFGVSPHGIWRPGNPQPITGQDAYAKLFADSRKWLANGWVDYFAPQLYWPIKPDTQGFPLLLTWWTQQNAKGRHVWPGIAAFKASPSSAGEIPEQIQITRAHSDGYLLYNATSVMRNAALAGALEHVVNVEPALVPASPWLGSPPGKPILIATGGAAGSTVKAIWQPTGKEVVRLWVLQTRSGESWKSEILPAEKISRTFQTRPDAIAITAVDRVGNLSLPATATVQSSAEPPLQTQTPSAAPPTVPKRPVKKYQSPRHAGQS